MDNSSSTSGAFQERIDLRQDPRYKKFVEAIGFVSVNIPTSRGKAFGYIKYVPLIGIGLLKVQRYRGEIDQTKLAEIIRKKRIWRTILEPTHDPGVSKVASLNKDPFLPTKTRVIRVDRQDNFSQNVKRILKRQKGLDQSEVEVEDFYLAWRKNSKIWTLSKNALERLKKCFGDDCILWVEKKDGDILGGVVCIVSGDWAYYFAAFVSEDGRKNNAGVWGVIGLLEVLRKRKVRYLDFEGVFDERFPRDSWKGFSEFKSRFGGALIELPGCYGRWF